jgi:lysozyme
MNLSVLKEFLSRHEGRRLRAYSDSKGLVTIGVGFNLMQPGASQVCRLLGIDYVAVVSGKEALTDTQCDALLQHCLTNVMSGVRKLVPGFDTLSDGRQMVLVDIGFAGLGTLAGFKKMLAAVSTGNWEQAADEILCSDWAVQVGHRAEEDAALMRRG